MKISFTLLVAALAATALTGCSSRSAGDATVFGSASHAFGRLPAFSLGEPGIFNFKIRDMGFASYPRVFTFETRNPPDDNFYTPFDESVLRVTLLSRGDILAVKTVLPVRWRYQSPGKFENEVFRESELPPGLPRDYEIQVEVVEPSRRRRDTAAITLSRRR